MALELDRPLVVFDLETTGVDINSAKIVSFGMARVAVDGTIDLKEEVFINPMIDIPAEATEVHGITNEMVEDKLPFTWEAAKIWGMLEGCDLGGFNVKRYDLPILAREFAEAGYGEFGQDRKLIDAMAIYHKHQTDSFQRRTLSAAVKQFLNKEHVGAHGALTDAVATAEVLLAMVDKFDLPTSSQSLHDYCWAGRR